MLKKGVTYIIEDVADDTLFDKVNYYFKCELIRLSKRYDDRLIIIKK